MTAQDGTTAGERGVRIRPLRPEDHGAVAELILAAYDAGGHLEEDEPYRAILADVASRAALAEILVAEVDTDVGPRVGGSVVLAPPGSPLQETAREDEYEFRMLAVHPDLHRRGIGRALLAAVVERARAMEGVHGVALTTMESMVEAQRLYASAGFVRTPERDWMLSALLPDLPPEADKGPFIVYVLPLD